MGAGRHHARAEGETSVSFDTQPGASTPGGLRLDYLRRLLLPDK